MDSATQSALELEQKIVSKKSKKRKLDDVLQNDAEDSSENPLKRAKESKWIFVHLHKNFKAFFRNYLMWEYLNTQTASFIY